MARIYMEKVALRHDDDDECRRALMVGDCASILYAMAFLTNSERTAIRILADKMGNNTEHSAAIATSLRKIAEVANDLADEFDRNSAAMMADAGE